MMYHPKRIIVLACILGATAVSIGAFGAHGLENILIKNGRVDTFETAVRYQFYHTLALLFAGLLMFKSDHKLLRFACTCFITGILVFSGSLYVLSLTNITILGAVAPLGGLSFIIGWVLLGLGANFTMNE